MRETGVGRGHALVPSPRRSLAVVALMLLAALAVTSVAGARTIKGTTTANTLRGTAGADVILGMGGADRLYGARGNDKLAGGSGGDLIRCGAGRDSVLADGADRVAADCERVSRLGTPAEAQVTSGARATQPGSGAAPDPPPPAEAAGPGHQHGEDEGHLLGAGAWGKIELVGKLDVTDTPDLVADVAVSPDGNYAYLANWGEPDCAANSEAGGINDPDAGAWIIDISDPAHPVEVGFIPSSQDTRPGEGMQVIEFSTSFFTGDVLVMNNEQCGFNGKGGISLWNVTDPTKPKKLSQHFGDRGFADTHEIHSAFAWDAGDRAYAVIVDNIEFPDVDILDITNPHRPRLIAELDLNTFVEGGVDQPDYPLFLAESMLHDMVVKFMEDGPYAGHWVMLLSYWDGGWVLLNVDDPADPEYIADSEYPNVDPELRESFPTTTIPPEGNAHQAEFTIDNRFIIGTDEDFAAYRPVFQIASGPNAGQPGDHPAGWFDWTVPIDELTGDGVINGPVVYGGYGCPEDAASIPDPSVLGPLAPGEEAILVLQRGPVEDPNANFESCFFSQKVEAAQEAGYDVVLIAQHHEGANEGENANATICGSMGHEFEVTITAICISHRTFHLLFGTTPRYDVPYAGGEPAIGTVGADVNITSTFDGWGYVWLLDAATLEPLDTFAIPEAHDPDFATGFGDLSVHEVAVDPQDESLAYLSYYAGGLRAIQIQCANPANTSTCELVEVGGYLDPLGNDFWGVETFVGDDGQTYILASDRDSGLWIFRDP